MTTINAGSRRIYHFLVPRIIRDSRAVTWLKGTLLGASWRHNAIYTPAYYETEVEGPAVRAAPRIADSIVAEFNPKSVVDVGCGTGALLEALRSKGCEVFGLEYADAALGYCRTRGLHVIKFDLEQAELEDQRFFDVAVSLEVAEHLPESAADRYVDLLCRLSSNIIFTAAPPGQGGADHVNEQPPSYWIEKFSQRGFEHSVEASHRWRSDWKSSGTVESWYFNNLMIFRRVSAGRVGP
jgi:SAM-dependent methyltransferase